MFMKTILFYITIFVLLMAACAPLVPAPATPTPVVTEEIPVTGSVAVVQSVEIEILESQPLQANAVIRGQLPDAGCTTIRSVEQVRDGNTIRLSLVTTTDPLALCAPALTPFEQVVPLDVAGLPPATYTVEVGGVEQEFELLTRDLSSFQQVLVDALNARDYELLKALMDDSFVIGYWQSEGTSNTPEAAIDLLRSSFLSGSSTVTADPTKNLIELLGMDPVTIIGPEATEASPLFVSGLGPEGKDEAILFTAKLPDGSLYWYGMLFARDGFAQLVPIQPVDTNAYQTSVQYIIAQRDVALFNGPGNNFGVIGIIYGGQIARVTGTNVNGSWWRVSCPDGSVGACWVSADTSLTQVTTTPNNNQPPADNGAIPTIKVVSVVRDDTVTIQTSNFPAETKFDVRMGKMGTKAIDGILVDTINSKRGGTFPLTFEIPEKLYGQDQIAIRLESKSGYFSYNWFDNVTSGSTPGQNDALPTSVKYVMALDTIVIRSGPGSQYDAIGSVAAGQTVKVTGISSDGNWWRIVCPGGESGTCWVSANPKNTKPTDDITGQADVQSVQIQILESFPVQVNAIARGQLPDSGCTTISGASQTRSGNTFTVRLATKTDPLALCALTITPFEYTISLDVSSLLPARYIVKVNGVEESFELPDQVTSTQ